MTGGFDGFVSRWHKGGSFSSGVVTQCVISLRGDAISCFFFNEITRLFQITHIGNSYCFEIRGPLPQATLSLRA